MRSVKKRAMLIGELASHLGISARTIRYYEMMGLVTPPNKTESGMRCYGEDHIKSYQFVLKLKVLGLSLDEMKGLTAICNKDLRVSEGNARSLMEVLDVHLKSISKNISALNSLDGDITSFRKNKIRSR